MDMDSTALVSYMLQALTSNAVVTLQSPHNSMIARHLITVEKVLSSYTTISHHMSATMSYISDATWHIVLQYLGKKHCVIHMEPQGPLGTFVTNTPLPSRSSRDSTRDEYQHFTGEYQPNYRTELGAPTVSPISSNLLVYLLFRIRYIIGRPPSKHLLHRQMPINATGHPAKSSRMWLL